MKITPEEQKELREGKPIFLNDMVNRKGEEFSSFIKADLETGRLSYSRTRDGFDRQAMLAPLDWRFSSPCLCVADTTLRCEASRLRSGFSL